MTTIPPMPEPPRTRDNWDRPLSDATLVRDMANYLIKVQSYAATGWVKAQEIEATLHGPMEFMRGEIVALKAKLEEAERVNLDHALSLKIIEQAGFRAAQAAALAEALETLHTVVTEHNCSGAKWGRLFDRMMSALSEAVEALTTYREGR